MEKNIKDDVYIHYLHKEYENHLVIYVRVICGVFIAINKKLMFF